MKRELKESQAQADCLELSLINARQDSKARQEAADSQNQLMAARIQDLAMKLCNAEKQVHLTIERNLACKICHYFVSSSLKEKQSNTTSNQNLLSHLWVLIFI